jgi:hypothetical protein
MNDAEDAAAALTNFALFWEREQDAKKRNRLLSTIFQSLTAAGCELTAVTPCDAFLPYFSFEVAVGRYGSDGTRTRDLRRDRPAF